MSVSNPTAATVTSRPDISVVVCTYGRPDKLDACLDALARQTMRDRAEVIVVDDGSDERTEDVARRYPVRFFRHDQNRGLAAARNTGIRQALAPVVAFTDDDCVPSEDWLEHLLAPYDNDDVVAVGGAVVALRRATLVHRYLADTNRLGPLEIELGVSSSIAYRARLYLQRNLSATAGRPDLRPVYSIVGANMSFRLDALIAIGLFDERITFGGEDEDICLRLRTAFPTDRLVFTSSAVIAHDYDGELRKTLRRSYRYGVGSARSYLKNADQNPTLFPVPALVVILALVGPWRRWGWAAAVITPLAVFTRWPIEAARVRRAELLTFPWLQTLEEAAHDVGFARSWCRLRTEYTAERDGSPESARLGTVPAHDDVVVVTVA